MTFTLEDATAIGEEIGIDWNDVEFTPESFLAGLEVELEHGTELGEETNVTDDEPFATGKITWAHLLEDPDYYELLEEMEAEFDGVKTEASTHRYAYVLDEIVEKHPEYISPEIEQMAMAFIKQTEKNAKQHAELMEDDEAHIEFLEETLDQGPNLGGIKSDQLLELLHTNPVMGAIPLADLKADNFLRGDDIDVYDYLEAALKHLVERVSLLWLQNERIDYSKEYEPDKSSIRDKETEILEDEEGTAVQSPAAKKRQQMGASAQRFATVRIHGKDY